MLTNYSFSQPENRLAVWAIWAISEQRAAKGPNRLGHLSANSIEWAVETKYPGHLQKPTNAQHYGQLTGACPEWNDIRFCVFVQRYILFIWIILFGQL